METDLLALSTRAGVAAWGHQGVGDAGSALGAGRAHTASNSLFGNRLHGHQGFVRLSCSA